MIKSTTALLESAGLVAVVKEPQGVVAAKSEAVKHCLGHDAIVFNKQHVKSVLKRVPMVHMAHSSRYGRAMLGPCNLDNSDPTVDSRPINQIKKTSYVTFDYERYCRGEMNGGGGVNGGPNRRMSSRSLPPLPIIFKPCKVFVEPLDLTALLQHKITASTRELIVKLSDPTVNEVLRDDSIEYITIDDDDYDDGGDNTNREQNVQPSPIPQTPPPTIMPPAVGPIIRKRPVIILEPLEKNKKLTAEQLQNGTTIHVASSLVDDDDEPIPSRRPPSIVELDAVVVVEQPTTSRRGTSATRDATAASPPPTVRNGAKRPKKKRRRCIDSPDSSFSSRRVSTEFNDDDPPPTTRRPEFARIKKTKALDRIKSAVLATADSQE